MSGEAGSGTNDQKKKPKTSEETGEEKVPLIYVPPDEDDKPGTADIMYDLTTTLRSTGSERRLQKRRLEATLDTEERAEAVGRER